MPPHNHVCGLYYFLPNQMLSSRQYLPQLSTSAYTKIVSSTSRTTLTQTFVNPRDDQIPELRYTFPLYDGVSVVGFVCIINDDRVIRGIVKERGEARKTYQEAVDRGETAGLLEQLPDASDVFTTTVGNVPANASIKVEITYLGELKHDAEVDGVRFTIPTTIAPRYGSYPGEMLQSSLVNDKDGFKIVVDVEMPDGCNVKAVQSPSHQLSVTVGNTSVGTASNAPMSLQKASATLALRTAGLGSDFVLQVVATNAGNPIAVLENHPTIPNHRALMTTLVPKFNLPSARPEIVFLCDRSGSMSDKIANLKTALHIFLKSLPVGVKFNICSFGSRYEYLFPRGSQTYDAASLEKATRYVDNFAANFGGTEIYKPMEDIFKRRWKDMDLEMFLLTDGEIWDQQRLFEMMNKHVGESKGAIRVFTLGIGRDVSHALIEGVARAGNGFSQAVGDNENMNSKVVRMLKASLTPHIKDYTLEVKYHNDSAISKMSDDDGEFELVERVIDALHINVGEAPKPQDEDQPPAYDQPPKPISLFDPSANPDADITPQSSSSAGGGKYSHVPPLPEPKLLQTPFAIPPLFPFSRTSVYLLLSPDSAQKRPKSVILRGTSPMGPVELEIPVTVLAEQGETIHQLAAKSAVKELEEGRGWIYHAVDNSEGTEGGLVKDRYPGRFSDMVEREAVRLGVTYQVGGKWCSFVAVEGDKEKEEDVRQESGEAAASRGMGLGGAMRHRAMRPANCALAAQTLFSADALDGRAGPTPRFSSVQAFGAPALPPGTESAQRYTPAGAGLFGTRSRSPPGANRFQAPVSYFGGAPRPAPPPPPPAPMAQQPSGPVNSTLSRPRVRTHQQTSSSFGSAPAPPLFSRAPLRQKACRRASNITDEMAEPMDESSDDDECGFALFDDAPAVIPCSASMSSPGFGAAAPRVANDDADRLNALVALQSFTGSWAWTDGLAKLLGLDLGETNARAAAAGLAIGGLPDVLATGLVVAYLEKRLGEKKDEWEMLADKARDWLEEELTKTGWGTGVEGYLEGVKKVLL